MFILTQLYTVLISVDINLVSGIDFVLRTICRPTDQTHEFSSRVIWNLNLGFAETTRNKFSVMYFVIYFADNKPQECIRIHFLLCVTICSFLASGKKQPFTLIYAVCVGLCISKGLEMYHDEIAARWLLYSHSWLLGYFAIQTYLF